MPCNQHVYTVFTASIGLGTYAVGDAFQIDRTYGIFPESSLICKAEQVSYIESSEYTITTFLNLILKGFFTLI